MPSIAQCHTPRSPTRRLLPPPPPPILPGLPEHQRRYHVQPARRRCAVSAALVARAMRARGVYLTSVGLASSPQPFPSTPPPDCLSSRRPEQAVDKVSSSFVHALQAQSGGKEPSASRGRFLCGSRNKSTGMVINTLGSGAVIGQVWKLSAGCPCQGGDGV